MMIHPSELPDINQEETAMYMILLAHPKLFAASFKAGKLEDEAMKLQLNREKVKPYVSKGRPLAHQELKVVRKYIQTSLEKGIIEQST